MPKLGAARLIIDDPLSGPCNMAMDQAILGAIAGVGVGTLRFYRWAQPTVSLGYFQAYVDRETHRASRACPIVRRTTGGGAIVHDHELTYSLCLPRDHRFSSRHQELYNVVHRALIASLAELGVPGGTLFESSAPGSPAQAGPTLKSQGHFLCFLRRSPGDVLLAEHKICGSAQRRVDGAILQHGSLLLRKSDAAPELPGVEELGRRSISFVEIQQTWTTHLEESMELSFVLGTLTPMEIQAAVEIQQQRFARSAWTARL